MVALDAGKRYFKRIAIRTNSLDLNGLTRRLRRCDDWFGIEVKRNTEHICILDVKLVVVIQFIRLASQRSPDDLFTQELRSKRSHAKHVGDRVLSRPIPQSA